MAAALAGIRVLEVCGPIGHYAGRLLADLGADVIKVEPPEGDIGRSYPPFLPGVPTREGSLPFLLGNANKRGVTIDLPTPEGKRAFLELLATADVLLDSWTVAQQQAFGLPDSEIEAASPALIRASITGWGRSGPRSEWAAADLVACAMSGVMRLAGFPDGPPEQLPDLQGLRCASINAVAGVLAALLHREATGVGQHIDVSMQEALLMAQETAIGTADILGTDRERTGTHSALGFDMPGLGLYECADGFVYLMASGTAGSGFAGLLGLMASEDAAEDLSDEPYAPFIATSMNRNVLVALLADPAQRADVEAKLEHIGDVVRRFLASRTKRHLYEEGQARRVLIGMVSTPEDIAASPQLAARGWFADLVDDGRGRTLHYPGPPWRLTGTPASLRSAAPLLGEHNEVLLRAKANERRPAPAASAAAHPTQALEGVRVLDLTWFGAGPIATRALASLGADVIRVETSKRPDGLRVAAPRPPSATSLNVSGYFNNYNSDKRSVTIDLTTPRGHELGLELVRWADVFMTNMTSRAVRQIGMTWEQVHEVNPDIVAVYQPMQGLDGPHTDFQGFGAILCTICGANYLTGFEANPPVGTGTNYPDYVVNPMHAVIAVLAALRHRRLTGEGQLIDMSQLESSVAAMAGPLFAWMNAGVPYHRAGNRVAFAAPHGAYPVAGKDNWLAIACLDESMWARLAGVMGQLALAAEPRFATLDARKANEDALDEIIAGWTRERDGAAAMEQLQAAGVTAGLAQRASEVLADPHLQARAYFQHLDHAEAGTRVYDGMAFRLSRTPARLTRAAPLLGEHTHEVAAQVLGLTSDEIADFVRDGVLV